MTIGRAYPKTALHKAIAKEIIRLGYKVSAKPDKLAVVSIEQLTIDSGNDSDSIKGSDNYEITWLLSVCCREQSPAKTDACVEKLRAEMQISLKGYVLQGDGLTFESCVDFNDMDEESAFQRAEQRCRLIITKN